MAKILVADDETDLEILIRQKFRQKIRENKYEFIFAINGKDALSKLKDHPDVDVVLSDINMPEMDGLTLLSKLKEISPLIKAVIVSAYGDMENIRIAMNSGAFDFLCKPVNFDDLDVTVQKTIRHVDELRATLQAIRENNILRMYVDETVLHFMNRREFENSLLVNETIDATVAFIDICSFTSISETESPDVVVNMLNSYFDVMAKEVIAEGGHVDKFIGDAVMAVFHGEYHLDRALDACLKIRTKIDQLPTLGESSFTPRVAIGLNSGEMIAGNIGSQSLRRLDYTVIGDVVNTAQRLQSHARPGQVMITEKAFHQVRNSFNCAKSGEVMLKNKQQPVVIYEVID